MTDRRPRHHGRRLLILLLVLAALAGWFRWQQNGLVTVTYEIPGAPEALKGYRIAVVSDLHGKEFGPDNVRLLDLVAELDPDCIALTGDLVDRIGTRDQLDRLPALARSFCAIAPTYYVTGNHEWAAECVPELKEILTENGVTVLTNEFVPENRNGVTLAIAGVDDPNGLAGQKTGDILRTEIAADYTVLLTHRDTVETYDEWGYDLILCGHGHGGMIRIPFQDRGLISSKHTLFPEYDGGCYPLTDGGWCLVSRGLGNNPVPYEPFRSLRTFRLFNRPEVPLAVLE